MGKESSCVSERGGTLTLKERVENILTLLNLPGSRSAWSERKNGLPLSTYDAVIAEIEEALREAIEEDRDKRCTDDLYKHSYEMGKRDSIIEFCEGDRSMLAEYEQKAFDKGFWGAKEECEKTHHTLTNWKDGFNVALEKAKDIIGCYGCPECCEIVNRIAELKP